MVDNLFDTEPAVDSRAKAIADLVTLWHGARTRHVASPFGCSCGVPTAHVSARDFELDLLDFVAARQALSPAGAAPGHEGADSIPALLEAVRGGRIPEEAVDGILEDLRRGIRSFSGLGNFTATGA